jgi:hypothetical protein
MKTQTAVEWLLKQLDIKRDGWNNQVINQAKEMEKQQIVDAFEAPRSILVNKKSHCGQVILRYIDGIEYYNETFKTDKG